jgi:hypothetical protein
MQKNQIWANRGIQEQTAVIPGSYSCSSWAEESSCGDKSGRPARVRKGEARTKGRPGRSGFGIWPTNHVTHALGQKNLVLQKQKQKKNKNKNRNMHICPSKCIHLIKYIPESF